MMWYYFGLALFDVWVFLSDNWEQLTLNAAATGIGLILGKRLGVRLTVNYITKRFNLIRKSTHELQTEHHEREIVKLGGQPWVVESKGSGRRTIGLKSPFGRKMKFPAPIARLFTRLRATEKSIYSRRKNNMSRKLILMLFGAIALTLSQFGITLDPDTIIGIGTLIVSAILGQSVVDTNGLGQYAPLKEKFKSKKLWTALGGSLFIVLNDYFKLGISADIIYWVVGIGVTYILGKSAVSVVQASKNAGALPDDKNSSDQFS
jgi:hypothetical protein